MKAKLIFISGLPGSGKSTYCRDLIEKNPGKYKQICKDDMRNLFDCGHWTKGNEKFINKMEEIIILEALRDGYILLWNNTHLDPKHYDRAVRLAEEANVELETKFFDTPLAECIKRDSLRPNPVGSRVITDMFNRYLKEEPETVEYNDELEDAILVDIDGTIAIKGDRNIYDYTDVKVDTVNEPVKLILDSLYEFYPHLQVIFCSGRDDSCMDDTLEWLDENFIKHDYLFMRKTGDKRKDAIIKKEIYDEHIKDKFNVLFSLDDRGQVVDLWRSLGIPCLQVADGNF